MIATVGYGYQKFFEVKLREIAKAESVLDVGGGERFQKDLNRYRELFRHTDYKTLDVEPRYRPDIVATIYEIPVADNSIGAIICKSVLEHLDDPGRAVAEMRRVLEPGGKILLYVPFIYPYHARPGVYKDYFRFSEDALRHLFRDFRNVEIQKVGGYFRALMFFLPYQHRLKVVLEPVAYLLDKLFGRERGSTTAGYYLYAIK